MSNHDNKTDRLREEAAEWCVLITSGDASETDKARFAEWIISSPAHLREFEETEALWNQAGEFGADLDPARGVISLFPGMTGPAANESAPFLMRAKRTLLNHFGKIAASLLLILAGAATLTNYDVLEATFLVTVYQTDLGESRLVRLEDGSIMDLNTSSRVSVSMDKEIRSIELKEGEAYFVVTHDPTRPFVVTTEHARIQAVGTEFNVRTTGHDVTVTVVEGKVVVRETLQETDTGRLEARWQKSLKPNQQLIVRGTDRSGHEELVVSDDVKVKDLIAWRENKLIFDTAPLRDVIADFNRYNETVLLVEDPELGDLAISGVFNPRDPVGFAKTLETIADVDALILDRSRIFLQKSRD